MIPVRGYQGMRVAVLGLGRSGLATARALQAGGAALIATHIDLGLDEASVLDLGPFRAVAPAPDDFDGAFL